MKTGEMAVIVIATLILILEKACSRMIVRGIVIVWKDIGTVSQSGLGVDYFIWILVMDIVGN